MVPDRVPRLAGALRTLETGRFAEAAAAAAALLAEDAADTEARLLLGLARGAAGAAEAAAALLDQVARARPDCAHPCHDLAALLRRLGRADQASAQYRAALAHAPADAALRRGFAGHLLEAGDAPAALAALDPADDSAAAHHLRGLALAEQDDFAAAAEAFRATVARDPAPADGWSNLGMMLRAEARFDAAIAAHDQAVARAPQVPQIRVNRAVALLHAGRFTEAWAEYEWRLRLPGHTPLPPGRLLPDLATAGDLRGRTILLTHEEGFGDTLQFVRYAPLLAARGARVILALPPPLMRLLAPLAPVVPLAGPLPDHDYHCPFFSLPRAFATTLNTIPAAIPYLVADPALVASWAARLAAEAPDGGGGLRVGLVWAGQARPWLRGFATLDRRRSAALADFAPLAGLAGVRFISLQAGPPAAEAASPPPGLALRDPMAEVRDFADTAAVIAGLDLVVSVDTAVVHLAGALGTPAFLLDRTDSCWRWLSGRDDSPWYPRTRIFRQERSGDWTGPMRRVAAAIAAWAGPGARSGAGPGGGPAL